MIPRVCPDDAPPGEKNVFRRLRDDPDTEGWVVLHSLDLARHVSQVAGEADFIVIVPGMGLLVIEVKSHGKVHVDDEGWHLGSEPRPDRKGPFKQASGAMHSIRDYLEGCDRSYSNVLTWSAVAFTGTPFKIRSPEWHDWQVIDRDRITSTPISRIVRSILAEGSKHLSGKGVKAAENQEHHASPERCGAIMRALRPRFEVALPPKAARKGLNDELLRLTEEQYGALDIWSVNPRVIYEGPAGTGKTVIAMEALRRACSEVPANEVALFCFNRFLGDQLAEHARRVCPGAVVANIDRWLTELAGDRITQADRNAPDFFRGRLARIATDGLLEDKGTPGPFRLVIVDEAQDLLQPHYLDVLDLVMEGGLAGGRWLMFGDFLGQDIFSRGTIALDEFIETRCPRFPVRFPLNTNCRNTTPISEHVVILGQLKPPYSRVLRGDDRVDPLLEFWSDSHDQKAKVTSFLRDCLDQKSGFRAGDIVLLCPRADGNLGQQLAMDPEWSGRVAPWGGSDAKIRYTTIQRFKGLESPIVVVTDFDTMDSDHQQSLFYIGLSRAQHRLGIFLHDDLKSFIGSVL